MTLANILRVDAAHHRPLPNDSELVQSIAVLARAQQDAVRNRQQLANQMRSLLREYYPASLEAFQAKNVGLTSPEAREILRIAPTPAMAARLPKNRVLAALRRAGRQRNLEARAIDLQTILRREHLRQLPLVDAALGRQALHLPRRRRSPRRPRHRGLHR
ncbi:hypothetical protein GCM10010182_28890 [Actinomadura cremea]|nr:hypothetical protein GCM10010182_28890 [Actinomadura cremea]